MDVAIHWVNKDACAAVLKHDLGRVHGTVLNADMGYQPGWRNPVQGWSLGAWAAPQRACAPGLELPVWQLMPGSVPVTVPECRWHGPAPAQLHHCAAEERWQQVQWQGGSTWLRCCAQAGRLPRWLSWWTGCSGARSAAPGWPGPAAAC